MTAFQKQAGNAERELNLDAILNRGIRFEDNVDCDVVSFTSSDTPDAENEIIHRLGKIPAHFLVCDLDKGAVVYRSGDTAWAKAKIYLKCNTATVAVTVILF